MIKKFIQGEADKDLFALLGSWTVSEEVAKVVGVSITGREGDVWHIYVDGKEPVGFAETRLMKNGKAHMRYCYAPRSAVRSSLAREVIKMAKELELDSVFINERDNDPVWTDLGFKKSKHKKSTFSRWEKDLK